MLEPIRRTSKVMPYYRGMGMIELKVRNKVVLISFREVVTLMNKCVTENLQKVWTEMFDKNEAIDYQTSRADLVEATGRRKGDCEGNACLAAAFHWPEC